MGLSELIVLSRKYGSNPEYVLAGGGNTSWKDTDSLYIDLSLRKSVETREISTGINLDYDDEGEIVGIDIDNASKKLDLKDLTLNHIPARVHIL